VNTEEFRRVIIDYLKENVDPGEDENNDDLLITHFVVVATAQSIDDPRSTYVVSHPTEGFPFAYQIGALEYVLAKARSDIATDD
jgi:hypothetical protein